jgi:4-hydroxyphenylpyruvate dioxygenase
MRTSIATVSLRGTLDEKLDAVAAAGFDAIELFGPDLLKTALTAREVRARAEALGLSIDLFQPLRDAGDERRAQLMLALAEQLGAPTLLVCSDVRPDAIADDARLAEQLYDLAEQATGYGVRIAFEALAWGTYVNTYEHAWRIVELADHPALGTCLDSFHILARGDDPAGIRAIGGQKIFFLQLADAPRLDLPVLEWSRHHRCFPGEGDFDLDTFVGHVLATGYDGPLSLEIFNDDPAPSALAARRSLMQFKRGETLAHV